MEPIIELIAENIKTAIDGITQANHYFYNLTAIRPRQIDFSDIVPADGCTLIYQEDEDPAENPGTASKEWNQTFSIVSLVAVSDKATEAMDIKINRIRADIQKKLMTDPSRGGYAIDTILGPSSIFMAGEGFAGIAVTIIVNYRVSENDPYAGI